MIGKNQLVRCLYQLTCQTGANSVIFIEGRTGLAAVFQPVCRWIVERRADMGGETIMRLSAPVHQAVSPPCAEAGR